MSKNPSLRAFETCENLIATPKKKQGFTFCNLRKFDVKKTGFQAFETYENLTCQKKQITTAFGHVHVGMHFPRSHPAAINHPNGECITACRGHRPFGDRRKELRNINWHLSVTHGQASQRLFVTTRVSLTVRDVSSLSWLTIIALEGPLLNSETSFKLIQSHRIVSRRI